MLALAILVLGAGLRIGEEFSNGGTWRVGDGVIRWLKMPLLGGCLCAVLFASLGSWANCDFNRDDRIVSRRARFAVVVGIFAIIAAVSLLLKGIS